MLVHYVEDDKFDVISMKRILRGEKSVKLRTSERMDNITSFIDFKKADIFMVDVRRPDSTSVEADVGTIRSYSDAPVVFVTGQDPEIIRERALAAGAIDVLRKDSLDPSMLVQILERACGSIKQIDGSSDVLFSGSTETGIESVYWPMVSPTITTCDEMIAFVETTLSGDVRENISEVKEALELVRLIRRISTRQFSTSVLVDASQIVSKAFDDLSDTMRLHEVKVSGKLHGQAPFWTVGSRNDAALGIMTIVKSSLYLSCPGDHVQFHVGCVDGMTTIEILTKTVLISSHSEIFKTHAHGNDTPSYGLCLMQAACHLLALRPEQMTISTGPTNRISIIL